MKYETNLQNKWKHWKDDEVELFKNLYPEMSNADLMQKFQRGKYAIINKANQLGLKKSPEYIAMKNKRNHANGIATRFKKGMIPWNKGLKLGSDYGKSTQFKKGNPAHNKLPEDLRSASSLLSRLKKSIKEKLKRYEKQ